MCYKISVHYKGCGHTLDGGRRPCEEHQCFIARMRKNGPRDLPLASGRDDLDCAARYAKAYGAVPILTDLARIGSAKLKKQTDVMNYRCVPCDCPVRPSQGKLLE